jgi:hypothetical protein
MDKDRSETEVIRQGRAYVRLIEAADVLLADDLDEAERVLLEQVRRLAGWIVSQAGRYRTALIVSLVVVTTGVAFRKP